MNNLIFSLKILFIVILFSCENPKNSLEKTASNPTKLIPNLTVTINDAGLSHKDDIVLFKNQLFSGYLVELSAKGKPISKAGYWQGKLEGKAEKWYENGQLAEVRFYKDNRKVAEHKGWWENGNKRFDYFFDADVPIQTHQQWYKSGKIYSLANYNKAGQPEGTQQMWYEDGKIKFNLVVKNGRRYGFLGNKGCENPNKKKNAQKS